jgi:Tfp pilus assembly protein PilO
MDAKHKKTSRRSLIITGVVASVAIAYTFLLFLPGQRKICDLRRELDEKRGFVTRQQMVATHIQTTQEEVETTREYVDRWSDLAPMPNHITALLGEITIAAAESGTSNLDVNPGPTQPLKTIQQIPVTLAGTGSFEEVFEFVRRIETLPQTVWIERLNMEAGGEDSEALQCEIALAIFAGNPEISD